MNKAVLTGFLAVSLMTAATASAASLDGKWLAQSGKTQVQIAPCGSNLCGTIIWLKTPMKDENNPDAGKRSRDLVGVQMLSGLAPDGDNAWKGKLYNFENGKTYTGKMTLTDANTLKLSGCIMGGVICKSQTWRRTQ